MSKNLLLLFFSSFCHLLNGQEALLEKLSKDPQDQIDFAEDDMPSETDEHGITRKRKRKTVDSLLVKCGLTTNKLKVCKNALVKGNLEVDGILSLPNITSISSGSALVVNSLGQVFTSTSISGSTPFVLTLGIFGDDPNADGATLTGDPVLTLQPASQNYPGGVSVLTQTFAGDKTFTGSVYAGGQLYAQADILNLANTANNPSVIASTASGGGTSLYISGKYSYVVDSSSSMLTIFDVSEPSNPIFVSTTATSTGPNSIYVSGRYAYIGSYTGGSFTLQIFDISDPAAVRTLSTVTHLSSVDTPAVVYVSGRYLYLGVQASFGLIQIYDISNPTSPTLLSTLSFPGGGPSSIYLSGKYLYMIDINFDTIQAFDVSNPWRIIPVGTANTIGDPASLYVSGAYAYVGTYEPALQIFDISNPAAITAVGYINTGGGTGAQAITALFVSGRYAYAGDAFNGILKIFDVLNPASIALVGSVSTNPNSVYVSGKYAYTAGNGVFQVIDIYGLETTAATVHSLEVGNLQVRNDVILQGNLQVTTGVNVGENVYISGDTGITGTLTVGGDVYFTGIPTGAGTNLVITNSQVLISSSSRKFKENIEDLPESDWIYKLQERKFNFKGQDPVEDVTYGYIAEEVSEVNDDMVIYKENRPYSLQYTEFIPFIVKELRKVRADVDKLMKK